MSDFTELRDDIARLTIGIDGYSATVGRHLLEQSRQIDKLWTDQAELRDEINAVANRLENLPRAVTTDPAEVAAAIVNDANRSTLRATVELEARMKEIIARQYHDPSLPFTPLSGSDKELDHIEADRILTDALRSAGFATLADLYDRVDKWYA